MFGFRVAIRPVLTALGICLFASAAQAQINNGNLWPSPRLATINPCVAQPGTTFEVTFTGTELDSPEALLFSHPGIKAEPIIPPPPKVDPKVKPDPAKPAPVIPITKFNVTVAKDVPAGYHDVRIVAKYGVSNPRVLFVENKPLVLEKEPNNDIEQAQKIELGQNVFGAANAAADVDYYQLQAKKGQRVVVSCRGASLDSKIYPELRVFTLTGRQIAYHRPLPNADGLFDFTVPDDGDYLIRLNQFTYTVGSAEYYYCLGISTGPWIDAIFPPIVEPGKDTKVTLYGRNLPGGQLDPTAIFDNRPLEKATVTIKAPNDPTALTVNSPLMPPQMTLDGFEYQVGDSNRVLVTFAQAPVILENDNNDTADKAQMVKLPCEIAGRIDKKRDRDWYTFEAKKGDVYMIELISHRLGAPTDMYFTLKNLETKAEITLQDDNPETISGKSFYTLTKDPPPYRFVVPADGKYHLMVASHIGDILADPTHMYRLRIAAEQPDFRLFAMPTEDYRPDVTTLGQGGTQHYWVFAQRRDGFKGEISVELEGLPPGVTSTPQVMGGNQRSLLLALSASEKAAPFIGAVKVKGTAVIGDKKVVREARPASVVWSTQAQNATATITRRDHQLMLAVRGQAPGSLVAEPKQILVTVGDKVDATVKLKRILPEFKANFTLGSVAGDLPTGITFANVTFAPGKDEQKISVTAAANAVPGVYNMVLRGFGNIPTDNSAKPKQVNTILPSTPIKLLVAPKTVANLTVEPGGPIMQGDQRVVVLKIARQSDYQGPLKVNVVFPKEVQGLSADPFVVPAGQNEAKFNLRVDPAAAPGPRQNIVLRAVGTLFDNHEIPQETKFAVNIDKAKAAK